jgi:hypothetical protein
MGVALREHDDIASRQQQRRVIAQFDVTLAFGDQVKITTRSAFGSRNGAALSALGDCSAGRGEPGVDENRADQAHDTQGL